MYALTPCAYNTFYYTIIFIYALYYIYIGFYGTDPVLIRRALSILETQGKVGIYMLKGVYIIVYYLSVYVVSLIVYSSNKYV